MSVGIRTACTALTTVRSAKAELDGELEHAAARPARTAARAARSPVRHIVGRPRSQSAHAPQLARVDSAT